MTYRDATIGVIVPAHDEEAFVGDVVRSIPDFVDRIYPVDDGSTDGTWSVILEATRTVNDEREPTPPWDRVVVPERHARNRGAGGAVLTGFRQALADGVDVVATLDGDGQMNPAYLPSLLDPVVDGRVVYAKGNRLASREHVGEMSAWRLFGNLLLTALTRVASGYWRVRDPQNGFTAISTEVLAGIDLDRLYERYGFRNDLLVHLSVTGHRIADVAHPARYGDEISGIRYGSFVPNLSWLLLRRFLWRLGVQARRQQAAADRSASVASDGGAGTESPEGSAESVGGAGSEAEDGSRLSIRSAVATLRREVRTFLEARRGPGRVLRLEGDPVATGSTTAEPTDSQAPDGS